tara:strand:+ start:16890 stop:17705 length:816 start_codon:yes stop_codon:yes gene_type:complete
MKSKKNINTNNIIYYIILILPIFISILLSFISYKLLDSYSNKTYYYYVLEYKHNFNNNLIPPGYVFSIVWTILYLLIGYAYANILYNIEIKYWVIPIISLLINYTFIPYMYIALESFTRNTTTLYALLIVLVSLVFGFLTILQFYFTQKNKLYSYILIPYILWLLFASYLSYNIYIKSFDIMNDETTNYEDPNNQTVIKVNLLDNPNITEEERKIILDDPLVKQYITPTQEEIDDAIDKLGSLDDPNLDNFTKIKIMNNPRLQRITAAKNE